VQAGGGVELFSSSDLSTWCDLPQGGNSWSCSSDRNLKENFQPVDGQEVLASLAEMPITTWNMKGQDDSIRHMGPVAQDFSAAFGLGESETAIGTADADGVALAAIQALYERSQEQAARIEALEEENANLQQQLDDLDARVTALDGGAPLDDESAGPLASMMPGGWLLLGALLVLGGLVLAQRRFAGGRS
jgi:trimeric autotransporter adhesin